MATDYAHVSKMQLWTHNPVWGDASWDSFVRDAHNPVHRGSEPMRWPVNAFLFRDPVSTNWYLYVGNYLYGYASDPNLPGMYATVYRSSDQGRSWVFLDRILPKEFTFSCGTKLFHAPDVSVVYDKGKYHMGFDWAPKSTWDRFAEPRGPEDYNGMAYAVADRPEGPFEIAPNPIVATGLNKPVLGRYKRFYAGTLIKRARDWMMVCMADSGPRYSWVMLGMTSAKPEGPWSEPHLLMGPDTDNYHPPIMEFYPAFTHDGMIYAPCTSVAANRNFQLMCEAKLEDAHKPEAWCIGQEGSMWHGTTMEHEHYGIWGQTFTGFVNPSDGQFVVAYPSKDSQGTGSINIARRPWNQPYRSQGFFTSAHAAPSMTLLRCEWSHGRVDARISMKGTCRLLWGYNAPVGANTPTADARLHDRSLTSHHGVELTVEGWRVVSSKADELPSEVASGKLSGAVSHIVLSVAQSGATELHLDGKPVWKGDLPARVGLVGWLLQPASECEVKSMQITPKPAGGVMNLLHTEALLGGGAGLQSAKSIENPAFRYGIGAQYVPSEVGRAKWNFVGRGFRLFSPCLPEGGEVELLLDGKPIGRYQCGNGTTPSEAVFTKRGLRNGPHALTMRATSGLLLVDSLEVEL